MQQRYNGSVTVFLSLSISLFLLLFLTFFKICVIGSEKHRFEIISDISNNSALGEYGKDLYDKYDLLYIDTSYLGFLPDSMNLKFRINKYINKNINDTVLNKSVPWGDIEIESIDIEALESACSGDGKNIASQMSMYVDDTASILPIYMEVINSCNDAGALSALETENAVELFYAYKEIVDGMELPKKKDKDGKMVEVPVSNPADWVYGLLGSDYLCLINEDLMDVSNMSINLDDYISHRGAINVQTYRPSYYIDENKVIAYIADRFSNQINKKETYTLNNQLEYLLAGKSEDYENLKEVIERIFRIRLADNLKVAFSDGAVVSEARDIALLLEVCTLNPAFIEPVTDSIVAACAFLETIGDVRSLMKGGKAPIYKASLHTNVSDVLFGNITTSGDSNFDEGYSYREWLEIMLKVLGMDNFIYRTMDLIEMEIRNKSCNYNFQMDWCIESYEMRILASGSGIKKYMLDRRYGYF